MIYLLETNLPENKSVLIALTYVYGINKKSATIICRKLGISNNLKIKDLDEEQLIEIIKVIDSSKLIINNELKKIRSLNLKKLISIKSYRGLRRLKGLPSRGQRTHTNAKSSRKGPKF